MVPLEYQTHGLEVVGGVNDEKSEYSHTCKRKCGIPIRRFYAACAILFIIIIGAIIGGVVGSRQAQGSKKADSGPDSDTSMSPSESAPNKNILSASRLARRWDSQNKTWNTENITNILSSTSGPVNPQKPYTPLASAASNGDLNRIHLWFLAPDNAITGATILDLLEDPSAWWHDSIDNNIIYTAPGSQLVAGEAFPGTTTLPATSPILQFATSTLARFSEAALLVLLPNGTVAGNYYSTKVAYTEVSPITFNGGPDNLNFTAIAATEESMFYGVLNDTILQYFIAENDESNSLDFEFVGVVYP
ncbi:hypothetical protein GGR57DRAFT_499221 [Xylariaceae sp. FL1272]|nr:hypothetical protein GGR57DRAFT_499221 [Xylariaceae sp. FL1272]